MLKIERLTRLINAINNIQNKQMHLLKIVVVAEGVPDVIL